MDNKDLIRQYIDTGQPIGKYQFDKLADNMKVTYLRKRMIAYQQDEDYKLNRYEIFGAPESYRPIIVKYLLSQMSEFFNDNMLDSTGEGDDFYYTYGDVNPVVYYLLKGDTSGDSRVDDYIIAFTQDERFIKFMNKATAYRILLKCENPSRVFSYLGNVGRKYKNLKMQNIPKAAEDVIYASNPTNLIEFLGRDELLSFFKNMEPNQKAYRLSNASNPKALLPILGYDTIAYIK